MAKKVLFIDRDGTILVEPPTDYQVDAWDKFDFVPGAITGLAALAADGAYELVLVSNQDGLGTASFPEETFWPYQQKMLDILAGEGVRFAEVLIDRSFAHDPAPTRKPGTGLLTRYLDPAAGYDLAGSYVIGDRGTDVELARNLGCRAIWLRPVLPAETTETTEPADLSATSWVEVVEHLRRPPRRARVLRATHETHLEVSLNLDGTGRTDVKTGLGFFDHLLDQLGKHSGCDLYVRCAGDLHVDEHHTVEDTALAIGAAYAEALGDKRGVNRYGFLLPMDDALAQAAIDFSGRPWLVWSAEFRRERVGDVPTELFAHFFKSFADAARCNLNIQCVGDNEHHKIESIFKAVAKAIKMAVQRDSASQPLIPSTKGVL